MKNIEAHLLRLGIPATPERVQVIYENTVATKTLFYRLYYPGPIVRFMTTDGHLHIAY